MNPRPAPRPRGGPRAPARRRSPSGGGLRWSLAIGVLLVPVATRAADPGSGPETALAASAPSAPVWPQGASDPWLHHEETSGDGEAGDPGSQPHAGPATAPATRTPSDLADASPWPPPARPRYLVERVEVVGNSRTDASVILGRVLIRPGELLDEDRVELSRLRLLATGYFTEVQLRLTRGRTRGQVVLIVEVRERPPLPVVDGIILGFSETTPLFGGLSLVDPNFLGRGVELGGGFVLSPDQQAYRARIAGGELLGSPLGARLVLLLSRGREPVALGEDPRGGGHVDVLRGGGYLGLSLAASHDQRFSVDVHGELIQADPKLSPRVRRVPLIEPGLSVLSTVQLAYQRDTRDRGFIPTTGAWLFVGAELSSSLLLSSYEYSRFHLAYEQFIPTFAHHSCSLRLDLGVIQPGVARGNHSGAPYFEAYYIGDYSFFRRTRNSLPRQLGLNLSAFTIYDDILGSITASYAYPLQLGGELFYRTYLYAAINVAEGTTLRELQGLDPADDRFPVTFDAGLKFDTVAGSFVVSASYLVDLVL